MLLSFRIGEKVLQVCFKNFVSYRQVFDGGHDSHRLMHSATLLTTVCFMGVFIGVSTISFGNITPIT